ncbi:hypothetical protein [Hirschia litorea]
MINMMVDTLQQPAVLWMVLAGAVIAVLVEAYKTSPDALWGDIFGDESND